MPQSKTAKLKMVALVAGKDRASDFFLDLGDFLATHAWQDEMWLLRHLRYSENNTFYKSPGTVYVVRVCACVGLGFRV